MSGSSWRRPSVTWLLASAPVAILLDRADAAAPLVFFTAALALIPLAHSIVQATETLAEHTGPAIGGLLNATFGNLPELIIAVVALRAGLVEMVRASLIGAILANTLLALGASFLLGGLKVHVQEYNTSGARTYSSMLLLAALALGIPAAFHRFLGTETLSTAGRTVDVATAGILLVTYAAYLYFMIRTHPDFFKAGEGAAEGHTGPTGSPLLPLGILLAASVGAALMSEVRVGAAEATGAALGMSEVFLGMILLAVIGGAAESGSAIAMGIKNKPDLAVGVAMGSSIQIALFVTPFLVLTSVLFAPETMSMAFNRLEVLGLFLSVLLVASIAADGRATWFKGVQLLTIYLILAATIYFIPMPQP
jgi:Ca2+:H+ antiporter